MDKFVLIGMETEIDWQLAHQTSKHVEPGKRNDLTFETPGGDVTLSVESRGALVVISKEVNRG